jgi:hypothetical protein
MRFVSSPTAVVAAFLFFLSGAVALAQDNAQNKAPVFRDVETKYIFGFTEGSGIGLEGEKEFSLDTEAKIGKRDGHYWASETKFEYEFTPNQYVQFELGPFMSIDSIHNVTGFDDQSQVGFGGVFGEIRYLLLDRSAGQPLSVTLSLEPEWRRIGDNGGEHENSFELEGKVNADVELIKNRLYLGSNLLYEPEATKDPDGIGAGWEMESKGGISGALSYRITPSVFVGGEIWYLRHYAGAWFNDFEGDALYIGPTLFVRLNPKMFITAAWNVQVDGREVDNPDAGLNLDEFSHNRAKFKFAVEF